VWHSVDDTPHCSIDCAIGISAHWCLLFVLLMLVATQSIATEDAPADERGYFWSKCLRIDLTYPSHTGVYGRDHARPFVVEPWRPSLARARPLLF
jgi:hypothetical protein